MSTFGHPFPANFHPLYSSARGFVDARWARADVEIDNRYADVTSATGRASEAGSGRR